MAFRIFSVAMIRAGTLIPGLKDGSMSQIASETFRNSGFLNAPFSAGSPMLHLRRQGRMRQHRCTPTAFDTSLFLCNPIFPMLSRVQEREAARLKYNPLPEVLTGKRVVVVDDSIVRGTSQEQIVGLLRRAGAREVHLRI